MHFEMDNRRVVVENVRPEIDDGRFPIKRVVRESVVVEADVFTDGHEAVSCVVLYRREGETDWTEVPMEPLVNDRWRGEFTVAHMGRYFYTVRGWLDHFKFWSTALGKRVNAGQDVAVELVTGAQLVEAAAGRAQGPDRRALQNYAKQIRKGGYDGIQAALQAELAELMYRHAERKNPTTYDRELGIVVDREKARFSTWYEMFPRSCWTPGCSQGTFKDVVKRLPYVQKLGFDVLYLPPIHPIGHTHRKGKNNSVNAEPGDVGSPWAIGSEEGGHKSIHPDLGTLDDFHALVARAREHGLEIALDIAFQCSPDHPYVKEHPQWFRMRPDGTIQYAENPPKKYEDIYPFDFETSDRQALWEELRSIFLYWIDQGVKIFRVDNPHTKSLRFWDWCINTIKEKYPETIFLAEAFTRPKIMYYLAKLGFTQSYNYFPWRNVRWELVDYFTELTRTDVSEFFRPNLWPNTPDILTEFMQLGGRPAFMSRLVLAATLGASYGIYGPAYELQINTPIAPGKEEYLRSEKYEIKQWDVEAPGSIDWLVAKVNRIRCDNPALQTNTGLRFHGTTNEHLLAYTKSTPELDNILLMVVNLDPRWTQAGTVDLPLNDFGMDWSQPYEVRDLITDTRYLWRGGQNYVELNPANVPAHIFSLRRKLRSEQDFDYYR